ncbi:putative autophagy protein [Kockovaella imperatae]|uniref:Autophagy-related protein n=1 Tax=Kockovaella imperatae TaxID=4999 RepID=A0A1Y1UEN9_9TREE|nr:putative autophagy protein [Kockovaella imperatae]ORX35535.1 putative autophagy protein [Kockovaella imperatae]
MAAPVGTHTVNSAIAVPPIIDDDLDEKNDSTQHHDHHHGIDVDGAAVSALPDAGMSAGLGVIEQRRAIPLSGKRKPTTKWEYWTYIGFYMFQNTCPLGSQVQAIRQLTLTASHPSGFMEFAGKTVPINTAILDINGALSAAGLAVMFILGPYADYGSWKPWILIVAIIVTWGCCFGALAIKHVDQWAAANVIWAIGGLSTTVVAIFYQATFPGLARDLPKVIQSEEDVLNGLKTPEEHEKLDSMERAQLYNYCNIFGSVMGMVMYGVAIGLAKAIQGTGSIEDVIKADHWLIVFYTPLSMIFGLPYLFAMQWRPGSAIPHGVSAWTTGPRQVVYAVKSLGRLKQCLLYLIAYVFLFESIGAFLSVYFILLFETIHYSPELQIAYNMVGDVCGGLGVIGTQLVHKKFDFQIKWIMFFGTLTSNFPNLWGALGSFTSKIGFKHPWEFWFFQAWNAFTACCGIYNVTMISEVAPASKLFMFYSLFKTVVGSTGFSGPFIVAGIIDRSPKNPNVAFWFLFAIGILATIFLYFVDVKKAKIDCALWAEREAQERYSDEQRLEGQLNRETEKHVEGAA